MQDSCILKYIFDVTARSCEYFSFMNSDKSGIVVKTIFFIVSKKAPRGILLTLEKIVITYYLLDTVVCKKVHRIGLHGVKWP